MTNYIIVSSAEPEHPVIITDTFETPEGKAKAFFTAKTIFCDKCNLQQPGSTISFSKVVGDSVEFIALVDFKAARFSTEYFYQIPAVQSMKINTKLWREG